MTKETQNEMNLSLEENPAFTQDMQDRVASDSSKIFGIEYDAKKTYDKDEVDELIMKLNNKLVSFSKGTPAISILDGRLNGWEMDKKSHVLENMSNMTIKVAEGNKTVRVPIVKKWWDSPLRRRVRELVFDPNGRPYITENNEANEWTGFPYDPTYGDKHLPILDFIMQHICNNRQEVFDWIINYCAHIFQCPGEKPRACVVIYSKTEGTGKGTFIENILGELLGKRHFMITKDVKDMFVPFNIHLRQHLLIFHDESVFAKNGSISAKMKAFITGDKMDFQRKGIDKTGKMDKVFHRHFISTNNEHAAAVSLTDRRYTVISAVSVEGRDKHWFNTFHETVVQDKEALTDFMGYLMKYDMDRSMVNNPIFTEEHLMQQSMSMGPPDQFWFELPNLLTGEVTIDGDAVSSFIEKSKRGTRVTSTMLKDLCTRYLRFNGFRSTDNLSAVVWGRRLSDAVKELGREDAATRNSGIKQYDLNKLFDIEIPASRFAQTDF